MPADPLTPVFQPTPEVPMTELVIERIVPGGVGLARTEAGTALVRGALPGERVRVRLEQRKGYLAGTVADIVEPHPQRVTSGLPPGADLPLEYEAQLPIKEEIVREALSRVGKVSGEVLPIAGSPSSLGYRTAAQYAVAKFGRLAARDPGTNDLVALDADALLAPPLAAAFDAFSRAPMKGVNEVILRGSVHEDRVLAGLVTDRGTAVAPIATALQKAGIAGVARAAPMPGGRHRKTWRLAGGEQALQEDFGGLLITVTLSSFAQVNPGAAGLLYREAAEIAGAPERAVDLYAGSGVLAFHLASRAREVVAVEIAEDAVRRGEADRRRLGLLNVGFRRGDARTIERVLPAELVAVNPPRSGLDREVIDRLAGVQRVLYVSCDPATWARDVGLLAGHGFRLTFARPYDFYPYTHHVEVLSLLER